MDTFEDIFCQCLVVSQADDFVELDKFQSDFHETSKIWSQSQGIWHHDPLRLSKTHGEGLYCLTGMALVDEAIEDEYTIVKLLHDTSQRHPDVWISISDKSDGEFLLTEAAEVLPSWLTPENSKYRLWLRDGKLWLLDKERDRKEDFSIREVVRYLRNRKGSALVYDERINEKALRCIQDGVSQQHVAMTTLSRKAASFLHRYPFYISGAYRALHDALLGPDGYLKINSAAAIGARGKYLFKTTGRLPQIEDPVDVPIRYSQRVYAAFKIAFTTERSLDDNSLDLGTKLMIALELMFQVAEKSRYVENDDLDKILECGDFDPMEEAKDQFLHSQNLSNQISDIALDRLDEPELSIAELEQWRNESAPDSDDWLHEMQGSSPVGDATPEDDDDLLKDQLEGIFKKVEKFMEDEDAGLEGIENENENDDGEDKDQEEDEDESDPKISEDDFFEFFLKEALKLTPEEIENYRAEDEGDDNDENSSKDIDEEVIDEEKDLISELQSLGIDDNEAHSEFLQSMVTMMKEQGQITGPIATLMGQLGLDISQLAESVPPTGSQKNKR